MWWEILSSSEPFLLIDILLELHELHQHIGNAWLGLFLQIFLCRTTTSLGSAKVDFLLLLYILQLLELLKGWERLVGQLCNWSKRFEAPVKDSLKWSELNYSTLVLSISTQYSCLNVQKVSSTLRLRRAPWTSRFLRWVPPSPSSSCWCPRSPRGRPGWSSSPARIWGGQQGLSKMFQFHISF